MLPHNVAITNRLLAPLIALTLLSGASSSHSAEPEPAYGGPQSASYANQLWVAMSSVGLVGPNARPLKPFFGGAKPHGRILEVANQKLTLAHHRGFIVVKRNYDEPGATVASVSQDRSLFLSSITVMFQREKGYDPDNQDWFWAKYYPDGKLFSGKSNLGPFPLAGRLAKGKDRDQTRGCLFCHSSAGDGDYIFYPEIRNPDFNYAE